MALAQNPGSWTPAGFHFTRQQLDSGAAGEPAEAHARRGAHWTFDAEAFVDCVRQIRGAPVGAAPSRSSSGTSGGVVSVPTFCHGVGDPASGGVTVRPQHRVVLIEGNYLLLGKVPPGL